MGYAVVVLCFGFEAGEYSMVREGARCLESGLPRVGDAVEFKWVATIVDNSFLVLERCVGVP